MTLHHVFWLSRTPLGFIFSLKKPRETLQKNLKPSTQIFRVSCPTCPSTYLEEQQTYHTFWWSQHRQVEELSLLTVLKEVTIQHIMEIKYSSVRGPLATCCSIEKQNDSSFIGKSHFIEVPFLFLKDQEERSTLLNQSLFCTWPLLKWCSTDSHHILPEIFCCSMR